jgi:hypothetical protein
MHRAVRYFFLIEPRQPGKPKRALQIKRGVDLSLLLTLTEVLGG